MSPGRHLGVGTCPVDKDDIYLIIADFQLRSRPASKTEIAIYIHQIWKQEITVGTTRNGRGSGHIG